MVELRVLHIVSLRQTYDQSLRKILPGVQEILCGHEIQGSNPWPWPVTLTLSWHGWLMGSAHWLTEANIWPKFNENLSKGSGDMERTRKCYGRTDGWTDGQTNGQTDRQTDGQAKAISIIPNLLRWGGLIISSQRVKLDWTLLRSGSVEIVSLLTQNCSTFFYFSKKISLDTSCKSSA